MNAWKFTLEAISRYYEQVFAAIAQGHSPEAPPAIGPLKQMPLYQPHTEVVEHVGTYLESARQLGLRSAELHLALAVDDAGGEFSREPMSPQYLRSVFQTMRSLAVQNLRELRKQLKTLPPDLVPVAQRVVELEPVILGHYRQLVDQRFAAGRMRIHGDFHLGQVLWSGRDFVFLDFEGDAHKPISERRIKRSPLRDVARMVRSFHHAAYAGFDQQVELGVIARENLPKFEPWVRHWNRAVSRAYLQAYCEKLHGSGLLPVEEDKLRMMLLAYLLNQVMDELGDELQKNSDNVRAPLQAILILTDEPMPVHVPAATETKTTN
jgi:maltose alpha-D-glucosyltransferase/alpha-amylase